MAKRTYAEIETENMLLRRVILHCAATFRTNRFTLICRDASDYLALEAELKDAITWTRPDDEPLPQTVAREAYQAWKAGQK